MDSSAFFLITVKGHEALAKLSGARQAVETLTLVEPCPESRSELLGILTAIEAQASALEDYTVRLRKRS